jgi:hypothetical protein
MSGDIVESKVKTTTRSPDFAGADFDELEEYGFAPSERRNLFPWDGKIGCKIVWVCDREDGLPTN